MCQLWALHVVIKRQFFTFIVWYHCLVKCVKAASLLQQQCVYVPASAALAEVWERGGQNDNTDTVQTDPPPPF